MLRDPRLDILIIVILLVVIAFMMGQRSKQNKS